VQRLALYLYVCDNRLQLE